VFGGEQQPGGDAREQQANQRGLLDVAIEGVDRGQEEKSHSHVRGHQRRMSHDVGVKADQQHRHKPGSGAEPLAGGQEDQKRQSQREQAGGKSHAEEQALACAVVAGKKVAAVEVGLRFEVAAFKRRNPQIAAHKRQRGQHLHQRRMLRVEAVIARMQHHVSGEDVVVFVPRERLAMHHKRHLRGLHGQQDNDGDPGPSVCDLQNCSLVLSRRMDLIVDGLPIVPRRGPVIRRSRTLRGTRNRQRLGLH